MHQIKTIKKNIKNNQGGFTVVEMIITMFIVTLIGVAIITFQLNIFSLNKNSSDNLLAQEDARRALKIMTAEIRSALPSDQGSYALYQTATSSLTFYTNADNDAQIEKVRYFLSGTTLKKGTIKPTGSPLTYNSANETFKNIVSDMANATSSIFSYYNSGYDGTASSSPLIEPIDIISVRLIKINIIIDHDPLKAPPALNMTTQVSIRNIKDNL